MVESTSSGSSSDTNEPVCTQLLTQLNTAYQHLAPDAQALVSIASKISFGFLLTDDEESSSREFTGDQMKRFVDFAYELTRTLNTRYGYK